MKNLMLALTFLFSLPAFCEGQNPWHPGPPLGNTSALPAGSNGHAAGAPTEPPSQLPPQGQGNRGGHGNQGPMGGGHRRGIPECAADRKRVCPDAQSATPELAQCMKNHQAELSEACKAAIAARGKEGVGGTKPMPQPFQGVVPARGETPAPGGKPAQAK